MANDPWSIIHAERSALARDLAKLSQSQWRAQSLCERWTVSDVVGHVTASAKMTPGRFVSHLSRAGFRMSAMNARDVARETAGTAAEQLTELRAHVTDSTSPPGPVDALLGEIIIHAEDIRRPLGIKHSYPTQAVVSAVNFYKASNGLVGAKRRIAGLGLRATDVRWAHGSGPEVTGPVLSLALAMAGRTVALQDLRGAGLDTLRSR